MDIVWWYVGRRSERRPPGGRRLGVGIARSNARSLGSGSIGKEVGYAALQYTGGGRRQRPQRCTSCRYVRGSLAVTVEYNGTAAAGLALDKPSIIVAVAVLSSAFSVFSNVFRDIIRSTTVGASSSFSARAAY